MSFWDRNREGAARILLQRAAVLAVLAFLLTAGIMPADAVRAGTIQAQEETELTSDREEEESIPDTEEEILEDLELEEIQETVDQLLEEDISITLGDIKDAYRIYGGSSFDVVVTNPPYMIGSHGLTGENQAKIIARHETLCTLEDILEQSARVLRPRGRFYMVHRPFRLAEILSAMVKQKIEPKRMRFVHPYVDKEPNLVLIEGMRGGRSRMTVEKPLIVYEAPGVYTREVLDIYGQEWKK